jgi:hypothetical protein
MTFKPTNQQIAIDTANNVYAQKSIRIFNDGGTGLCSLKYSNNTTYSTFLMFAGQSVFIEKATSDKVEGTDMYAVPVVNYKW